jgi:hypothetical protein
VSRQSANKSRYDMSPATAERGDVLESL